MGYVWYRIWGILGTADCRGCETFHSKGSVALNPKPYEFVLADQENRRDCRRCSEKVRSDISAAVKGLLEGHVLT